MKIHTILFNILSTFTIVAIVLFLLESVPTNSLQPTHAQRQGLVENRTDTTQNMTKTIQISVTEEGEVYRWSNIQGTNPTLKFLTDVNNTVQILNPTNEKHEMIIGSKGKELASSEDIARSSTGHVSFTPNATGTLEYHCEYHPDTMKGIIVASLQ